MNAINPLGPTLGLTLLWASASGAEPASGPSTLDLAPVLVTSTRLETPLDRAPAALSRVDRATVQVGRQGLALDESLARVPGLFFQNRYNFAQDQRISIRGFGARANFGIRGVKVLIDDIPATLADGQTVIDDLDLGSVDRIEVIRGPAGALHGPAAGGVISLFTEDGPRSPFAEGGLAAGSHGLRQHRLKLGGQIGDLNVLISGARTALDGFREHARSESRILNSKLRYDLGPDSELTMVLGAVDSPTAQDPGGLRAREVASGRSQAQGRNVLFDAGEAVRQLRLGLSYWRAFGPRHALKARSYYVWRDFENRLPFAGAVARSNGGQVRLDRRFAGGGVEYTYSGSLLARDHRLVLGFEVSSQEDDRRRFVNRRGDRGPLTLDQTEEVASRGLFVHDELSLSSRWSVTAGTRFDVVEFEVRDRFRANATGDDSGGIDFEEWSYRIGVRWSLRPVLNVYAGVSTSFETPTTTELANPAGGGFNPSLAAQTAVNYELGMKGEVPGRLRYELAAFAIEVDEELVPFELSGQPGRSFFANAGRSERRGVEAALRLAASRRLSGSLSYTFSRFRFARFVKTELAAGVPVSTVLDGNTLPGVPRHHLHAELAYEGPAGVSFAWEWQLVDELFADDENTVRSPGYAVSHLRLGWRRSLGGWEIFPYLGINNLFDTEYNDNVRLNAASGRFFEPAPGRHLYAGVRLRLDL